MLTYTAGTANTVSLDVVAKSDGSPISAGTVNFYLIAVDGDNAGKWFKAADSSWSATEASAGAATYKGGALWQLSIAAAAWINGVTYELYAKESGDLNVVYTERVIPVSIAFLYESGAGGTCPVDLAEMKLHLRVDHSDDDDIIAQMMLAATAWAENFQNRTYINRERTLALDEFASEITIPYPPLISVDSVAYIDTDGVEQTLAAAYYRVDTAAEPGRITEAYGYNWPLIRHCTGAVTITYTAGYGEAADVPEDIKAAVKLIVGHLYAGRGDSGGEQIPQSARLLLWPRRIVNV